MRVEHGLRVAQERGEHRRLTVDRALPVLEDEVVVRRRDRRRTPPAPCAQPYAGGYAPQRETHHPRRRVGHRGMPRHRRFRRAQSGACPKLSQPWYGSNAQRIQTVIDARGTCSGLPGGRPLAVFDWDNTIIKNDISDQTFFWMLRHDKVRQPAGRDWTTTSTLHDARGRPCAAPRVRARSRTRASRCRPARTRAAPTSSSRSARTRRRRAATRRSPATTIAAWRARTSGCPSSWPGARRRPRVPGRAPRASSRSAVRRAPRRRSAPAVRSPGCGTTRSSATSSAR